MRFHGHYTHEQFQQAGASALAEVLRNTRVLHYRGVPADTDCKRYYRDLASAVGQFVKRDENLLTGDQSEAEDDWLDIRFVESLKTVAFRHSDTRQPIHTDGAYMTYHFDISFFYCEQQARYGGATTFFDGPALVEMLRDVQPALLAALESTEVVFDKGQQQHKVQRVIRYDERGPLLNWNHFRVSAENPPEVRRICDEFHIFLEKKIVEAGLLTPVLLQPGEAAFFHDDRILHGRNSFIGERCLIKGGINL
ncbi:MAG: TauD/TfdA family dioxygenase [Xanthomonadales bacterium]|jgi:alpha-ketoglutarate-dependent taurine dioxygenase|nr:TauD/TfdA family dioxygenase [Xanthomonadales bacterium]